MIKKKKKEQAEGTEYAGKQSQMEQMGHAEGKPAHISRDLFCDWQEGKLKEPEEIGFFTHIGACTFCAEQFANWMEEGCLEEEEFGLWTTSPGIPEIGLEKVSGKEFSGLAGDGLWKEPPRYLKEEILSRTHQLDVQASVKFKETSRQVQLMVYSLKVGFAVVASIFLLAVTADIQNMDPGLLGNQQAGQVQAGQEKSREDGNIVRRLRQGSKEITGLLNELSNGLFRIE